MRNISQKLAFSKEFWMSKMSQKRLNFDILVRKNESEGSKIALNPIRSYNIFLDEILKKIRFTKSGIEKTSHI